MKHLNTIFKALTIGTFILITVFSLFFSPVRVPIESSFNFTHAIVYFVLTICGLIAIQKKFSFNWCFFPLFAAAYGYLMEFLQQFVARHFSFYDAASNCIGILIAVIVMSHYYLLKHGR